MREKNEKIINLKNISFCYEEKAMKSLNNVNLSIRRGEVVVVYGESGCGKTTLMRLLNGLIPGLYDGKLEGSGTLDGMNIGEVDIREISDSTSSVFQDPRSQFFTLEVFSEIAFGGEVKGISTEKLCEKLESIKKELAIDNILNKKLDKLSSGEKQKVAIASSLMQNSKIILMDEPSANLDDKQKAILSNVLANMKQKGYTIILFEHRLEYIQNIVDRYIYMECGTIVKEYKDYADVQEGVEEKSYVNNNIDKAKEILRVNNIGDGYSRKRLLWNNVSFSAVEGEVIGIWGENGRGKTTLIKSLMGLRNPRNGEIFIKGKKISRKNRKKYSSYVMQDADYQLFSPTISEQLLAFVSKDRANEEKMLEVLEDLGLSNYISEYPLNLSGGQKQRVTIGMAAMKDAPIWYMDEPTSGLDRINKDRVYRFIEKYSKQGRCIFIITHDYELLKNTCTSILKFNADNTITKVSREFFK